MFLNFEKPTSKTIENSIVNKTIEKLYKKRDETGDVAFIVESQNIRAHRSILAALSPNYEAKFHGLQPHTGDVNVEDVTAAAFNEFLQFFYIWKMSH